MSVRMAPRSPGTEVFRRHWLWILFGSPFRAVLVPAVLIVIALRHRDGPAAFLTGVLRWAIELPGKVPGLIALQLMGFVFLLIAPFLLTRWQDVRRRIEFDEDRREIRFRGFVLWKPYWRPRFGEFTLPYGSITSARRHRQLPPTTVGGGRLRAERPFRVIAGDAVVDIPPGMTRMSRLESRLQHLAVLSPGRSDRMTELGIERYFVLLSFLLWIAGVGVYFLWVMKLPLPDG